ncbi:MIP family channel protein [Agathobaculum sp.]|uniref:MIP family channel protein n=1 Tax=Agathobaculum sp. TaxID=2048138 RepID=UPI002A7FA702|nr:MIP family channel protein [Agathobaculum sp.]MDY3617923.1 MIP family channel protein [Agathobaculum sp.]
MKKLIAEFVGTAVLVIFGCGSAVAANTLLTNIGQGNGPLAFSTLLIAFAFGLVIVAMAYSIGNVSGCHINPAVSLGMLVAGRMEVKEFARYLAAQFLGGIAGAAVLIVMLGSNAALGTNGYGAASALGIGVGQALIVEIVLTFVFVLAVLGVTSKVENSSVAGLVIGLTLTLVHILGIPFTGTSVNPARSFGPALLCADGSIKQVWVFIVAPLVGAALAGLFYKVISSPDKSEA